MKKNNINFSAFFITVLISLLLNACTKNPEFKTSSSGIKYAIITSQKNIDSAMVGDARVLDVKCYSPSDSLIFNSDDISGNFRMQVIDNYAKGSIEEALTLINTGDSAIFYISALNFYNNSKKENLPAFLNKSDMLRFEVKYKSLLKKENLEVELKKVNKQLQDNELKLLENYINALNPIPQPELSGLYFILNKKTNGIYPKPGNQVTVHYTGYLINGKEFDNTALKNKPFSFILGTDPVIYGWTEGITKMRKGEKATLIIPSHLAYGDEGYKSIIPPFSTLIFEIELIDVK